jgi:hypothetical protein
MAHHVVVGTRAAKPLGERPREEVGALRRREGFLTQKAREPGMSSTGVAAENAAGAEAGKPRERRRLHVPTSVLVTLLVATLSVWIAPAFTRQWDDRKQARQLQADVAEQVALATADLGQRIDSFARAGNLTALTQSESVKEYWQTKQTGIDVRLRAYFSSDVRSAWLEFNEFVEREVEVVELIKYVPTGDTGDASQSVKEYIDRLLREMNSRGRASGVESPFAEPTATSGGSTALYGSDREQAMRPLFAWMRGYVDRIVDRVMTEDPGVFSTSRRDLLGDLLP